MFGVYRCRGGCSPLFFFNLVSLSGEREIAVSGLPSMFSVPVNKIAALFNEKHIIDLVNAPDFVLGQPGDGPGILSDALPTAETVIELRSRSGVLQARLSCQIRVICI
jgi:hypothetical protein